MSEGTRWHLKGSPYDVQREALRRSFLRRGYGWGMEPGLGKTATALNEFIDLHLRDKVDFMVVVCPKTNMKTWAIQAETWGWNNPIFMWPEVPNKPAPYLWMINYEALMYGADKAIIQASSNDDMYLVGDESHWFKNFKSVYSKKMLLLRTYASFTRALTGTPQTRVPTDWWPQLRFVHSAMKDSPIIFRNNYAKVGGFMGKTVLKEPKDPEGLAKVISECFFIATKAEWAKSLPPKLPPITIQADLEGNLLKHYNTMMDELVVYIQGIGHVEDTEEIETKNIVGRMNKLQQISSGFIRDTDKGRDIRLADIKDLPKTKALMEILSNTPGKTIVFTYYNETTRALSNLIEGSACIRGSRDPLAENNADNIDRFNNDPDCRVLIGSLAVTSTGHTLLGDTSKPETTCSTTVFFENSYALGDRRQAEDRNHRFGQTLPVTYYDIVSSDAERSVIESLQQKTDIINTIIGFVKSHY